LAQQDAVLRYPEVAGTFSCAIEAPISETATPKLYGLLRRAQVDTGSSTGSAKAKYMRRRPFAELKETSCTPQDESRLANDGSYPSGHTAIGWGLALVLTEVVPERANQILARGYAFGQSRVVCGVHWQSDVNEGRVMASSAVARMHANPEFATDVAAARAEVDAVRKQKLTPSRDCSVEAAALAIPAR
ncbi:MAG TPA: phosphatase PAP2 family protein, partial [Steroidobacteraceae bacterium]|nr:phosphatase PAP2 family protein [Steroidobacteraceae bacterium]